jgi:hypothetical protein
MLNAYFRTVMHLNLPKFNIKIKKNHLGEFEIFDEFRKKYLYLTPEEWVRQNFLHFLANEFQYPKSLIEIEKGLTLNNLQKRADALVYSTMGNPLVLLEFKAPHISLNQNVMEQIARYNLHFKVPYLMVSNGLEHYCFFVDFNEQTVTGLNEIPHFNTINTPTKSNEIK